MNVVKKILIILLSLVSINIFADSDYEINKSINISSAYYFPNTSSYLLDGNFSPVTYTPITSGSSTERTIGSTWGAVELMGNYKLSLKKDFLTGGSTLTKDNNIEHVIKFAASPVDINISASTTLTPIAFLQFTIGSSIATGWKALGVNGLAIYTDETGVNSNAFQGAYFKEWLSGTFQFDLSAVLGGDKTWKHVVLLSNHNLIFNYFTAANQYEPWIYQGGDPTFNGFKYEQSTFLGYKMPLVLSMAGILFETGSNLFSNSSISTLNEGGWGSDFVNTKIGFLLNFKLNKNSSIVIMPQIKKHIRYTNSTVQQLYFKNRHTDTSNPYYWDFNRIAISYTHNL